MDAKQAYEEGRLAEAIAAASAEVKAHPTDPARRGLLSELLCFAGEWERADKQLDAIGHQDPQIVMTISLFRHLIRAEQARHDFYERGRVPEFLGKPSPRLQLHLQASICCREGQPAEALTLLERAEEQRAAVAGTCDGAPFANFWDLDDLTTSFFEVLTSAGKFFWIPIETVEQIEFRKPERLQDLLWRQASLSVRGGPDDEVFFPVLYAGSHADSDDQIRLGRLTHWQGGDGAPIRGVGQRTFMVGDSAAGSNSVTGSNSERGILDLDKITFTNPISVSDVLLEDDGKDQD